MNDVGHRLGTTDADEQRLRVLLLDYEMARDDERSLASVQATTFGVAVALTAFVTALTTQTCQFEANAAHCVDAPQALLAGVPLGPLAMFAFLQILGTIATVRSYYLRALEAELRSYAPQPLASLKGIPPASYIDLTTEMVSLRRGRLSYRLLNFLVLATLLAVFGGLAVYIGLKLSRPFQIAMALFYGLAGALVVYEALHATVGGRRLFDKLARRYVMSRSTASGFLDRASTTEQGERSLFSYLVLPRPEDTVKWLFLPMSFALAAWSLGGVDADHVLRASVIFVALELLIYEARYQWNDIRGLVDDKAHPERATRRRLPVGQSPEDLRYNVRASLRIALVRVFVAFALAVVADHHTLSVVALLCGLVFGTAIVYEGVKDRVEDVARTGATRDRFAVATWVLSGTGYAVRGVAGLTIAGLAVDGWVSIGAIVAFTGFGIAFVTMTWVLEALSHCKRDSSFAKPIVAYGPDLKRRNHLRKLLDFIEVDARASDGDSTQGQPSPGNDDRDQSCRDLRGLKQRGRIKAPWNAGMAVSTTLAGAIGVGLGGVDPELPWSLAGGLVGLGGAVALAYATSSARRWVVVLGGSAALAAIGLGTGAQETLLTAVPWLIFAGL